MEISLIDESLASRGRIIVHAECKANRKSAIAIMLALDQNQDMRGLMI